ncbi:MAG: hypothetical protein H6Q52_3597 [Deltaproteobacteria bacterium]|nr:hypothetical protein [Deltaproteobacteria bacterium]
MTKKRVITVKGPITRTDTGKKHRNSEYGEYNPEKPLFQEEGECWMKLGFPTDREG